MVASLAGGVNGGKQECAQTACLSAHGGDIQTFKEQFGREPLDFSANINPLGMSPLAKEALAQAIDRADAYPDPLCRVLRDALAQKEEVKAEYLWCGNGAADLIYRLVLAARPQSALLPVPGFVEYEKALRLFGCQVQYHVLKKEEDYRLTEAILPAITPTTDILFLCEPNNPTGLVSDPDLLKKILDRCRQTDTLLVVDECFNGFLADPARVSLAEFVPLMPRLVILKAFTKLYGMAGVRLGYMLCSDTKLLAAVAQAGQHWPVSLLAQAAGSAALRDEEWLQRARVIVATEREKLKASLKEAGCKVYSSQANYLFFHAPYLSFDRFFAQRGILIRDCSTYHGLEKGFYRIAIRTEKENKILQETLSKGVSEALLERSH